MANSPSESGPRRDEKGRFLPNSGKPKQDYRANGQKSFGALRGVAFRLINHLENALPKLEEKKTGSTAGASETEPGALAQEGEPEKIAHEGGPEAAAGEAGATGQQKDAAPKWTNADYTRLLGRNGGVVECFSTLANLIVRRGRS
jgi:hypothetical protein